MGDRAIENRARKIKKLEAQKKAIEAEINDLKDEIKTAMEEREIEECKTKNYTVRWKIVISNSFDSKRFKAENPDVYSHYVISGSIKRFTIV